MRILPIVSYATTATLPVWPESDGDLPAFMQQMTNMHVKRWKEHRHEIGYGHLYQGRYKCFPVETESYFYQLVRYVERNALRANLVARAEAWPWSSLRRAEARTGRFPSFPPGRCRPATGWKLSINRSPKPSWTLSVALSSVAVPGQRGLGCRDRQATENRVHPTVSREAEKRMLTDFVEVAACRLYANTPDLVTATFFDLVAATFFDPTRKMIDGPAGTRAG